MRKEGKRTRKKDGLVKNYANSKKVMSSNLPLLFANGRPRSLDTISQLELEDFVPFMILCSLGQELHKKPKEINNCPVPEWWPQGFPFKFPLVEQSDWLNRQVMLKSLVCRCYTFYDCEFLLKFSSELAEMPPSHLKFEENVEEHTTSIYDASGCMLVKCRNENLNYDTYKNRRRYLSPIHRSLSQSKKFDSVIDLTYDTSSEDDKEVYFKEAPASSRKSPKRKGSVEVCEAKKRCVRRIFHDFPKEEPEPTEYDQEQYMAKLQMIPPGKEIVKQVLKVDRKKRLAHSFTILSVSSLRGQELLVRNKHSFNLEATLDRIDRYCGSNNQVEAEKNQVCTRSSVVFSAMYKEGANEKGLDTESVDDKYKWFHTYKWPHRTRKPVFLHRGLSVKPCSVQLTLLSEETINFWTKRRRTVGTMTPVGWCGSKIPICDCQKIPLIVLDDETLSKYKNKSSSTRCTCIQSKQQLTLSSQVKKSPLEIKYSTSNKETQVNFSPESSVRFRQRNVSDSPSHGGFSVSGSGLTRSVSHSYSYDKEGLAVVSHNYLSLQNETSLSFKRAFHRRPLSVVPPTPVTVSKDSSEVLYQSVPCIPGDTIPLSFIKINFHRSILDAIKWYTKDDLVLEPTQGQCFVKREGVIGIDQSQENIKPLTALTLLDSKKPIDYFKRYGNSTERDYCFKRSSDGTSKLVTRRGERHYINREPCPSCFQGRDNFCVYEFVRQAKLAGVTLHKNQKQLKLMFFDFIQAVSRKV